MPVCKISVLVPDMGVILLTGRDIESILSYVARKYPGAKVGEPRWVIP